MLNQMTLPEIDRFLAERLMEWAILSPYHDWYYHKAIHGGERFVVDLNGSWPIWGMLVKDWSPTTNPAQALGDGGEGTVVGILKNQGYRFKLETEGNSYCALFVKRGESSGWRYGSTPSEAICRAAVEALLSQVNDPPANPLP